MYNKLHIMEINPEDLTLEQVKEQLAIIKQTILSKKKTVQGFYG